MIAYAVQQDSSFCSTKINIIHKIHENTLFHYLEQNVDRRKSKEITWSVSLAMKIQFFDNWNKLNNVTLPCYGKQKRSFGLKSHQKVLKL